MTEAFREGSERVIHRGRVVTLSEIDITAPDGRTFTREVVRHPGAVSIVPLLDDGQVVLVRQYRAALGRELLEIPAGKRDVPDEPPQLTAQRELLEEVGLWASRLELLATFHNSPGFTDEYSYVYLGRDLTATDRSAQGPEEDHLVVERVPLADVPRLITSGELTDAKSIIGLLLALQHG